MHANSESFQTDVSDRERDVREHGVMESVKVGAGVMVGVENGEVSVLDV